MSFAIRQMASIHVNYNNFECSKTATTNERVELVHQTVMEDHRFTVKEIAEACGISSERVHKVLLRRLRS